MINIRFINPLIQFGKKNFSLLVSDSEKIFPDLRVEKKYPQNFTLIQIAQDLRKTVEYHLEQSGSSMAWKDFKGIQFTIDKKGGLKDGFTLN